MRATPTAAATAISLALVLSACHDASVDPVALLVTEETRSALHLGEDVPALPGLISRAGMEGELNGAIDLWLGSWEREMPEAVELRERAYDQAAGPLARVLGHTAVVGLHASLGEAVAAVGGLPGADLTAEMRDRLGAAARAHRDAGETLARSVEGRGAADAEALRLLLRASDDLRAVGPEGVARTLVARAERAAERALEGAAPADGGPPDPRIERGDRLVTGARAALGERDWRLAIRRAYYACQLLGVSPL